MIRDGPCSSREHVFDEVSATNASPSIAQIISLTVYKKRRTRNASEDESKSTIRHNREQETPLPVYIWLKNHAETRNRSLIDTMSKMGRSISYDRVISFSTDAANSVCSLFEKCGVVCLPKLRKNLFTTSALDSIDHRPSATTTKD